MNLLEKYCPIVGEEIIDELMQLAHLLKGSKIVHINSTKVGGGVAEILVPLTELTRALGLEVSWEVITGNPYFFECTKQFHNGLQGDKRIKMDSELLNGYEKVNEVNADRLKKSLEEADFVIIHDPQPAALIQSFPNRKNKWVWRCHIDASNPNRMIWKYLRKFIEKYDSSVFSSADFAQSLPYPIFLIPPSIDPLNEKNVELSSIEIKNIVSKFGIDSNRPMILQVSRFDYFKDPIGVIEAYHLAKKI